MDFGWDKLFKNSRILREFLGFIGLLIYLNPPEIREFENTKFRININEFDFVVSIFFENNLYKFRGNLSELPL